MPQLFELGICQNQRLCPHGFPTKLTDDECLAEVIVADSDAGPSQQEWLYFQQSLQVGYWRLL
jgi:hypothetical protein